MAWSAIKHNAKQKRAAIEKRITLKKTMNVTVKKEASLERVTGGDAAVKDTARSRETSSEGKEQKAEKVGSLLNLRMRQLR